MSTPTPVRVRQRTRQHQHEGTVVKSVEKKVSGKTVDLAETNERFAGTDEPSPAYVGVTGTITKSPRQYESVKVSVSVTLPCPPTEQKVRETFDKASILVDELIGLQLENSMAAYGGDNE